MEYEFYCDGCDSELITKDVLTKVNEKIESGISDFQLNQLCDVCNKDFTVEVMSGKIEKAYSVD